MRAVWLTTFGGPEVLVAGDAPDPEPGPGEVLVDVAYANITFVETMFRRTGFGPFTGEPPLIPGNGVGGIVAAVGDGVDRGLVGRRVVTTTGGSGGYAERVSVPVGGLIDVPPEISLDSATALLADGRTALMLMRAAAPRPGAWVLVEAAAGGVGSQLVQLARAAGARVVAAAGGARKIALARDLGADAAVDYTAEGWTAAVRETAGGLDVVFDGVGGAIGRAAFDLLGPGGRFVSFGLASGAWPELPDRPEVTVVRGPFGTPQEIPGFSRRALAEAAAGRLRPVIGQVFPMERAADAHAAIETRTSVGKTLLEITPRR
ncbi:NADPH:quinone reductase [Virgisporangium aliadipatigenens]|uniref:NADPH:quinone reductase n=1 Tax=Virgisporangium aliadipatigenens TaxID=741659 RepID=A0A8J3YJB0_9ACTN|nr:zinc-binding dehydrogenase [Virgisporangium aliadipatigenens]GIJ46454.1 NADPH:quinone reductase [Virgisporangium aliadipatigenens]